MIAHVRADRRPGYRHGSAECDAAAGAAVFAGRAVAEIGRSTEFRCHGKGFALALLPGEPTARGDVEGHVDDMKRAPVPPRRRVRSPQAADTKVVVQSNPVKPSGWRSGSDARAPPRKARISRLRYSVWSENRFTFTKKLATRMAAISSSPRPIQRHSPHAGVLSAAVTSGKHA